MILDVTAGNRHMWPNKNPPYTIFLDRELNLKVAPDIFASWQNLPFRDDSFSCIIFDPPHGEGPYKNSIHHDPQEVKRGSWWGYYDRLRWRADFVAAGREFYRVAKRLCLKWNDARHSVWKLIPLFRPWKVVYKKERRTRSGIGEHPTWWVTFIRGSEGKTI